MVNIVGVSIVEEFECVIIFTSGQYLVRIEFVAYDKVVSGGILEFIYVVIRQDPVGISIDESDVVVGGGVRKKLSPGERWLVLWLL